MKAMKKILTTLALAALSIISVHALPADPTPRTIRQKDGTTVTLVLHGDEHHHWYTNLSGQRYALSTDGIFRPVAATKASVAGSGKRRMTKSPNRASITQGSKKFLVVLIEFQDLAFSTDKAEFEKMLNQEGYSENGATGSVHDYFFDNSSGQFNPHWDVVGPVKVSGNLADYGGNDGEGDDLNPDGLLAEACDSIYTKGLARFADYDNDGDGVVENIYYFYAGYGEAVTGADPNSIWPHSYGLYGSNQRTYDGKRVVSYACGPEFKGLDGGKRDNIGTFCHEFGHVLGLPDFYDIDYEEDGEGVGLGIFSLMDSGCYNNDSRTPPLLNAEERVMLGWMPASAIKEITSPGNYTLQPISNNVAYKTPTGNDGEYYLYECRTTDNKWDAGAKGSSSDVGMNGLLVYHVDKSSNIVKNMTAAARWENWKINNVADHQCFYIVAAKPSPMLISDYFFGQGGRTEFSDLSNPKSTGWSGKATCYNLSSIAFSGGNCTFALSYDPERKVLGTVTDSQGNPLSGVSVSVTPVTSSSAVTKASGNRLRSPLTKSKAAKYSLTTDASGNYSVTIGDGDPENFVIVFSMDGYKPSEKEFSLPAGRVRVDAVMIGIEEKVEASLFKYGELGEQVSILGFGNKKEDIEVAAKFTADELSRYAGMRVSDIIFMFYGTSAEAVDAIVESGGKRRITHKVSEPGYTDEYVNWTYANVKNQGYVIPSGEDVYFGYALKGIVTDNGYPIVYNAAEEENGGAYVHQGYSTAAATDWRVIVLQDESGEPIYCDAIIAVRLVEDVGPFDEGKVIVIVSPSAGAAYKAGANFDFKLRYGDIEDPTSVVWYYDGTEQDATSVTLTSGRHEVKALCTFADGSTEEIIQIIKVQ